MGKRVKKSVESAREPMTVKSAANPLIIRKSIVRLAKSKVKKSPPKNVAKKKEVAVKAPKKLVVKLQRCPSQNASPMKDVTPKEAQTITKGKLVSKKNNLEGNIKRTTNESRNEASPEEPTTPVQKNKFSRLSLRRKEAVSLSPAEIIEEVNKGDKKDEDNVVEELFEAQPPPVSPIGTKRLLRCSVRIARVKSTEQTKVKTATVRTASPEKSNVRHRPKINSAPLVQSKEPSKVNDDPVPTDLTAKTPPESLQCPRKSVKPLLQVPSRKPNPAPRQLKSQVNTALVGSKLKPISRKKQKPASPKISSPTPSNLSDDIYDFPSQSSLSETDDATADVIQKLVKQGRIALARNVKPKKSRKKNKVRPANWQKIVKNLSVAESNKLKMKINKKTKPADPPKPYVDDHFDTALDFTHDDDDEPPSMPQTSIAHHSKFIPNTNQSFSKLARKVMTQQTAQAASTPIAQKNRFSTVTRKEQLLEIAKSFAQSLQSTPNRSVAGTSGQNNSRSQLPGNASPWRVENENIPQTFYFSRNKDDLPSYSSDVIPCSQPSRTAASNVSLNLSNIENVSPEKTTTQQMTKPRIPLGDANPRHGIPNRSPLKPINILDVFILPDRAKVTSIETDSSNKMKENSSLQLSQSKTNRNKENAPMNEQQSMSNDLFGFDDYDLSDDGSSPKKQINLHSKKTLRAKLVKLKRLLPPKPTRISYGTVRSIFKPLEKQRDIRKMLSSTMIGVNEKKSASNRVANQGRIEFEDESLDAIPHEEMINDDHDDDASHREVHLFDDYDEPQTSFDKSIKIKTYERYPKRKAVRKRNNFILFSNDSEEEGEEDNAARKKRTKRDRKQGIKQNKELHSFIQEFNSMCDEVDQYELVVDKSNKNSSG